MSTVTDVTVAPAVVGPMFSLHGNKLKQDAKGKLASVVGSTFGPLTNPSVNGSIAVADENTNVRAISIQLKDANGVNIAHQEIVELFVFSSAARTALATGGSTGIALGANGVLLKTVTAKLYFVFQTDATGLLTLTWTDTGTESVAICVRLPNGNTITSTAFANT